MGSSCVAAAALALPLADAAAVTLTRGPYLQLLTTQSALVVWNTDTAAACSVAVRPLGGPTTISTGGSGTVCAISVTGLTRGVQYGYTPRAGGSGLTGESIFRADDPARVYTFLVVGDSGSGSADQVAVRDRMLATPADFILHTGDMVYDSGAAADFDPKFFTPYKDLLRRLVFWPCLGNHDWQTASGQPWRDAFYTPADNPAGSENYYSFDFGNAHVAVLNSNGKTSAGSPQYQFLDQDLATSNARWKFVVFHHTIYSNSQHGSNMTIRANLVPLFDKHGVDIVFMGHDHDYERTKPLRNDVVVAPNTGTVYLTTGGGGQDLYPAGTSSFTAYSESAHHFTRVAVNGDSLTEQMIRVDGVVRDQMTLAKGSDSTVCRNLDGPPNDVIKPLLRLARLGSPAGTLRLAGRFAIPVPISPPLDLVGNGIRIAVRDRSDNPVVSAVVPGGAFDGTSGWTANRPRTRWTFRDRSARPVQDGIARVLVKDDSSRTPGLTSVSVTGRNGTYAAAPGGEPFHMVIVLNDAAGGGSASQCGEGAFTAGRCIFASNGSGVQCR